MSRPALSLYHQLPIAYKHRCLLLSVLANTEAEINDALPQISTGFTGVVLSRLQLESIPALQQSPFPKVVYFIVGVIVALLGIRFVLQLLGASEASGFVNFIYRLTEPLVAPFYGIFQTTVAYGAARLELESVVAMVIYTLIGWGIASLIRLALK